MQQSVEIPSAGSSVAAGGDAVLAPSGKGAGDENFPVGSRLIAPALRPDVMRYYAFARAADDIADSPDLAPEEKIRRLDALEAAFQPGAEGPEVATRLRESLAARGIAAARATDLLVAFRQDATLRRYADWAALLDYCAHSAHPVGRFLLDLHAEDPETGPLGDALCAALQVLNHLQDMGEDRRALDRVYLPEDWMAEAGIDVGALDAERTSPGLRRVMERCLDEVDALLDRSEPLAGRVRSRRLGAEVAVIQTLARRLSARLRREDPLARRVRHRAVDWAVASGAGLRRVAFGGRAE